MIVVFVIGILSSISIPNFLNARNNSRQKGCVANLKRLDSAKEQWAMETGSPQGSAVTMAALTTGGFLRSGAPVCPGGGLYSVNAVGSNPTCSLASAPHLHLIP